MALKLLQPGTQPLGQFDGKDTDFLTLKGGEIVSFASVATAGQPGVFTPGQDQAAYDQFDGYVNTGSGFTRPVVSHTWDNTTLSTGGAVRPLMLADDGIAGYGTLFGSVVGGTIGQQVTGGAVLGPHTATGSGKVTCWDKPGLYAVSLDNVDASLQPSASLAVGQVIHYNALGQLSTLAARAGSVPAVARLVEFNTNQSLVTTPNYLVAALNSPSGNVSSVQPRAFQFLTFYFAPPVA